MIILNSLCKKFKIKRTSLWFLLIMLSCSQDLVDDPIQFVPFEDIVISLSQPQYQPLSTDGGYVYVDGGARGIILYRKSSGNFLAFERNCSLQPNDACATVEVHSSTLYMQDPCCGSTFNYEGIPTGGQAWRPLQQYYAFFQAGTNTLTITDEVL